MAQHRKYEPTPMREDGWLQKQFGSQSNQDQLKDIDWSKAKKVEHPAICSPHNDPDNIENSPIFRAAPVDQDPNGFELQEDGTVTNQVDDITLCRSCYCMTKTREGKCGKCKADKPVDPDTNYLEKSDSSNSLKSSNSSIDQDKELYAILDHFADGCAAEEAWEDAESELIAWRDAHTKQATSKVDRFEVIDETGREYVRGFIYGSPVSVELSYQDDGKTLKVFVKKQLDKGE